MAHVPTPVGGEGALSPLAVRRALGGLPLFSPLGTGQVDLVQTGTRRQ